MLDLNPSVGFTNGTLNTGLDTAYVATDNGVEKYFYGASGWARQYALGGNLSTDANSKLFGGMRGVAYAGMDGNGHAILFGTTDGNNSNTGGAQGNALVRLVDTGSGADSWQVVAYSPDNTWFTGVQAVTPSAPGDADGDGAFTADDYALLDRGFAKYASGTISANGAGWRDGDFNYDGAVDSADYLLLDIAYAAAHGGTPSPELLAERQGEFGNAYVQSLIASVPEPASVSILGLGSLAILCRRRRCTQAA